MAEHLAPLSVRLSPELLKRLESIADRLGIKKHTLAQLAIEAAVAAADEHGGRLVLPMDFTVSFEPKFVPTPAAPAQNPQLNEGPVSSGKSKPANHLVVPEAEVRYLKGKRKKVPR